MVIKEAIRHSPCN